MKFQIASIALVLPIACPSADAYAPTSLVSRSPAAFVTNRIPKATRSSSSQLFSQWDEDDEEESESAAVRTSASYEEAEKAIGDEDDQAAMDDMGDFDASGTVSTCFFAETLFLPQCPVRPAATVVACFAERNNFSGLKTACAKMKSFLFDEPIIANRFIICVFIFAR